MVVSLPFFLIYALNLTGTLITYFKEQVLLFILDEEGP